jgi:hypothetical protein
MSIKGLEAIVKTLVESGSVQGTQPHPETFAGEIMKLPQSFFSTLLLIIAVAGCSPVSTHWHEEKVSNENALISIPMEIVPEILTINSHGWKILDYNKKKKSAEWGFKVNIKCNVNTVPSVVDECMSRDLQKLPPLNTWTIKKIKYSLYDKDGFHLTTIIVDESFSFDFGETIVIQESKTSDLSLLKRAHAGRIEIVATPLCDPFKELQFE